MAETEAAAAPAATTPAPKKTKGSSKPRKPKSAPSHPKVSEMVNAAIADLKEKGGSSLQAIKKYIASHYKVDMDRLTPFVRKYLKNAVASGALVQTKGKGASGSFKMSGPKGEKAKKPEVATKKAKTSEKKAGKKAATPRKPKSAVKKTKKPKAAATKKPKTSKPKASKPKKPKSPAKKVKAKK